MLRLALFWKCPLFRACPAQTAGPEELIRLGLGLVVSLGLWVLAFRAVGLGRR